MKYLMISLVGIAFAVSLAFCSNDKTEEQAIESTPIEEEYDAGIEDDIITHELELENLLEQEQTNPNEYLVLEAKTNKNLRGEWIMKGTIENTAKQAVYTRIPLEIKFYDKLDSLIFTAEETLSSGLSPQQTIDIRYELKQKPSGAKTAVATIGLQ